MKRGPVFAGKVVLTALLLAPVSIVAQEADTPAATCELHEVMNERRMAVRERNSVVLTEGIGEKNADILADLTRGDIFNVCSDLFDQEIAGLFSSLGFLGALLSNELKKECRGAINKVKGRYREILNEEVAVINDPFGVLSNDPVYRENRKERISVQDAIEMAREGAKAAQGVPLAPPGREPVQAAPAPRASFGEGARNAIKGL